MEIKGRARKRGIRGEKNHLAKLTENDVFEIKKKLACGERQIDIANAYYVTKTTICDIAHSRSWRGDR
jgi:hypothetical protein